MSLLKLRFADGNELITYADDHYHREGCPTCDYGSEYINEIEIGTTHYFIEITFSQMYEYAFTTADAIRIFAVNIGSMTEDEFVAYIEEKIREYDNHADNRIVEITVKENNYAEED